MAIKNPDGTPFQTRNSLQQYNPENPEFDLFNLWDQEIIEIGGSPIHYYEAIIQMNTVDPLYLEDRGKIFSPNHINLYGWYDPIPGQHSLTMFGFDGPDDEIMMQFNYNDVIQRIGHPPKLGSRLFTPHRRENWVITRCKVEEYKLWGQLRLQVLCKRFQESSTIGGGKVTKTFSIDAIGPR